MIRAFLTLTAFLVSSVTLLGQTTLPTEWDFATTPATLPTGWSTNTSASYSSGLSDNSGGTSKAGKLQTQGHHFTIHFYDEPGTVTYNLRAYSSNGSNFMGTFTVQESENGSTWNTLETFNNNDFGNSWDQFTNTPDVDSRYIRFYFTTKVSGINVGLDDVEIAEFVPLNQEINVVYDGNDVPSGTNIQFASPVSTSKDIKLGIENLGSQQTLTLGTATLSGSAASDYSISSNPSSVGTQSSDTLVITFLPTASGSRTASVSIPNNDSNEDPYIVNLDGIGGTGASEPASNPSSMSTSMLKTYRVKASFDAVTADGYIVLFKKNMAVNATLVDGTEYEVGQGIGNAKVAHIGSSTTFWVKEATADDTFHIAIYAFNGNGNFINYKNDSPLTDSIVTPLANMQSSSYYSGVDPDDASFVSDLHDAINPHSVRFYSNYGPDMIPRLVARDTTGGQDVLTCVYSGENVTFSPPFGWPETSMNREHTFPASWMPSAGSSTTPEYQDFHHLFPTISTPNSQRSNHPLGEVVTVTNSYGSGKVGTNSSGQTVYEPRESQKGDAARAIFYMQTCYHDPGSGDSWAVADLNSSGPNQKMSTLLNWHMNDLPDGFEHARNDYLDSLQGNRNPYVDSAYWACYVDFKTMTHKASPDSNCLEKTLGSISTPPVDTTDSVDGIGSVKESINWIHFPNPALNELTLSHPESRAFTAEVFNALGESVLKQRIQGTQVVAISELAKGLYVVRLTEIESRETSPYTFRLVKN